MDRNAKFELAMSIMNTMSGYCYHDLDEAQSALTPDAPAVGRLKAEYLRVCNVRDGLASAGEKAWDEVIAVSGAEVRRRTDLMRRLLVVESA